MEQTFKNSKKIFLYLQTQRFRDQVWLLRVEVGAKYCFFLIVLDHM